MTAYNLLILKNAVYY